MIKYTRYIIKKVIIGVLISLILSLIYACDVKAESISDLRTSSTYSYGIGDNTAPNSLEFDRYYNINANRDLYLRVFYYITGISYPSNVFGRYTICSSPDATWTGGWAISDSADDVVFMQTKIPCNFIGSNYVGNVLFATYKGRHINMEGTDSINASHIIASHTTNGGSFQIISHEFSFNQFPTYYPESKVFDELDLVISTINQLNSDETIRATNIINTINTNTSSIISAISTYTIPINQAINNQTQSILNAMQNGNQAIIDNQNQNTQESITSQQVCQDYNKNSIEIDNKYLNNVGYANTNNDFGISKYIKINKYSKITYKTITNQGDYACFYNVDKELISCIKQNQLVVGQNVQIPNNSIYFRFSVYKPNNIPTYSICSNGNQATNDSINDVNDTLNDSSVDDPNNSLTEMNSKIATNSVISDLLLLPVTLFQNVLNSINGTCSTWNLGSLLGTNLTLPCISLSNILGSSLYGVIDVLLCGLFVLSMRKKFVDIFQNITSLKDRGNELE